MACKVTNNGIVCIANPKHENEVEHTCLHCDGCGIVYNRICKSCNGHGVIAYDVYSKKIGEYSATPEQLAAMKTLGGVA
jgi:DnaJ-class molecular chaperone